MKLGRDFPIWASDAVNHEAQPAMSCSIGRGEFHVPRIPQGIASSYRKTRFCGAGLVVASARASVSAGTPADNEGTMASAGPWSGGKHYGLVWRTDLASRGLKDGTNSQR